MWGHDRGSFFSDPIQAPFIAGIEIIATTLSACQRDSTNRGSNSKGLFGKVIQSIHCRDLKTKNILMTKAGSAKIGGASSVGGH